MENLTRLILLTAGLIPAPLLAGPAEKNPQPLTRAGGWRVSAGFMHRSLGDFDWLTGTMSTPSLLTIGPGSNTAGIEAIGPADAFADRTYFDGFVRQDGGTAEGGDTWNWGYDNASQVSGNTISFHGGNGTSATLTESHDYEPGGWAQELDGNAPYINLAWMQPWRDTWSIGLQGGFSYLSTGVGRTMSTFTANKGRTDYAISYTDLYNLGEVIPPDAPYAGGIQGPGPLLPNIPAGRTPVSVVSGGEAASALNSIHTDFDLNLSSLSLGPVMEFARGPWAVTGSAGITINIAGWDVDQRETLFVSHGNAPATAQNNWRDHRGGTDVVPGLFIQAAASRKITESWSLELTGRYDWVDDFNVSAGPSTGSVDLSGWSLGVGVGFRF